MNFNYEALTESLDDPAFAFCAPKVYPLLYFKVVKLEDMRRIDLAEKLYKMNDVLQDDIKWHKGSLDYYRYLLLQYLKNYAKCAGGTRAHRYYERATEMANAAPSDNEKAIVQLKDTLMIFLSIARTHPDPKNWKEPVTVDVKFHLLKSDENLLDQILWQKDLVPQGLAERKMPFDPIIKLRKQYFYTISMLLLCSGLQDRGAFFEESV